MPINRLNDSGDLTPNNKIDKENITHNLLNNSSEPIKVELDNIKNNYEKEANAINTETRASLDTLMLELT